MTDDRLADLAPHQRLFHGVLVDDFARLLETQRQWMVKELEHRDRARFNQYSDLRAHLDARHDAHSQELDTIRLLVEDGQSRLGKLEALMDASAQDRAALHAEIADVRQKLDEYVAQIPTTERAELARMVRDHEKRLGRIEAHLGVRDDGA